MKNEKKAKKKISDQELENASGGGCVDVDHIPRKYHGGDRVRVSKNIQGIDFHNLIGGIWGYNYDAMHDQWIYEIRIDGMADVVYAYEMDISPFRGK